MFNAKFFYEWLAKQHKGKALFLHAPEAICHQWNDQYKRLVGRAELLTVDLAKDGASFTYLFDYTNSRLVGVWGMPIYNKNARDKARMQGAPLGAEQNTGYHRGHMIAHSLGGGTDINLVPQLGSLNIGAFRVLEKAAQELAEEGFPCLYAVRVIYTGRTSAMPGYMEQVLMQPNGQCLHRWHSNSKPAKG